MNAPRMRKQHSDEITWFILVVLFSRLILFMLLLILQKFGKQMIKYIMKGDNFSHQKSSLLDMHVQLTKYLPG